MKTVSICLVVFLLSSMMIFSQSKNNLSTNNKLEPTKETITVFKNIRVFDGKKLMSPCTVIIKDSKIIKVGQNISFPKDAEVYTGDDLTLIPGLIDAHVHMFNQSDLRQSAIFGVTTVMDMMTSIAFMQQTKAKLKYNKMYDMADFFSAGQPATFPGGHGTEWGTEIPTLTKPEEAENFVKAAISSGSDYIKIMSGMGSNVLNFDVIKAVASESEKKDLLTLVHIETRRKALEAIYAGVKGLAHCFADSIPDQDFIKVMKEKNAFVIPTLTVMINLPDARRVDIPSDERFRKYLVPEIINSLETRKPANYSKRLTYKSAEETVRLLHEAGVRILAGSDSYNLGTTHGASLHCELELLTYAGLTPIEALISATSLNAETFGMNDRGTIQSGKRADLVLVKGDPTVDITATRNIEGVWLDGRKLNSDLYLSKIEKLHKEWKETGEIPAPLYSESGLICDFNSGDFNPSFGFYLFEMSDKQFGGSSQSSIKLLPTGAENTSGSLMISGNIDTLFAMPWAGMAFFPSAMETSVANLSKWNAISFKVKGDVAECMVMFMLSDQQMPVSKQIPISKDWKTITIPFKEMGSSDGKNIFGMIIGQGNSVGYFNIQIDDLRLSRLENTGTN